MKKIGQKLFPLEGRKAFSYEKSPIIAFGTSDMNIRQLCEKFDKKRNKIKRHSLACSYIWHIDILISLY